MSQFKGAAWRFIPRLAFSSVITMLCWLILALLLYHFIEATKTTLGWPLIHDAPLMQYIAWRITQGDVPYRDIFDMNFPVTYLIHVVGLELFGFSDAAWRWFDLFWLGLAAAGILAFCRSQGLLAAFAAALFFMCFHVSLGNGNEGQRDFLLSPFLIWGLHFTANAVENSRTRFSAVASGILFAGAFWIKPYALLLFGALVVFSWWETKRLREPLWMLFGWSACSLLLVAWLAIAGALVPFWELITHFLIPIYRRLGEQSDVPSQWMNVLNTLIIFLPFLLLPVRFTSRYSVLVIAVIYGVAHFLLQGKGWQYHLYPVILALTVCAAYRIGDAMKENKALPRWIAFAVISVTCWMFSPNSLTPQRLGAMNTGYVNAISIDLQGLVAPGDKVQAMDTTVGAINALYRLRLAQPTRFIYDFPVYNFSENAYIQKLRREFVTGIDEKAPKAIVITNQSWPNPNLGYGRLGLLPDLVNVLNKKYQLIINKPGYLIYVRK